MVKDGVNEYDGEYDGKAMCFYCSIFGLCRTNTAKQHSERHKKLTNKTDVELNPYLYTEISFNIQFNSFHTLRELKTAFWQQAVSLLKVHVQMENHSHMVSTLKKCCCPVQIHCFNILVIKVRLSNS